MEDVKYLDHQYELPNRKYFSEIAIPALYVSAREKVNADLHNVEFFAATTDLWSSSTGEQYMSYTVHFVDSEWCLQSRHLQVLYVPQEWMPMAFMLIQGRLRQCVRPCRPGIWTAMKSLLGLLNCYGKFISHLSTLLYPLNSLLKVGHSWNWSQEYEAAFQEAKCPLSSAPVLVHYDSLPICLARDASSYSIGAILSHILPNGSEHFIASSNP